MWIIILIAVVAIIVLFVINTYNTLVGLRNKVKDQWAQIDVQLKRRFDLIPNLVETVKGYAKHESDTLEAVVKARNTYLAASTPEAQMKADGELTQAITKLFALSEAYPELKANENFNKLQDQLQRLEEEIAASRRYYNGVVNRYNTKTELFPGNIIAGIFGFKRKPLFEVSNESERENVQVKF